MKYGTVRPIIYHCVRLLLCRGTVCIAGSWEPSLNFEARRQSANLEVVLDLGLIRPSPRRPCWGNLRRVDKAWVGREPTGTYPSRGTVQSLSEEDATWEMLIDLKPRSPPSTKAERLHTAIDVRAWRLSPCKRLC